MPAAVPARRREKAVRKPRPRVRFEAAVAERLERLLASITLAKAALARK
ncbi:MAG: hypothetical protein HY553_03780 [Elusimicrobia bacterium]|nr:hypothetical protein [Elusimicrobiota bacterium]